MVRTKYLLVFGWIILLILPAFLSGQEDDEIDLPIVDYGVHKLPFEKVGSAGWQFLKIPSNARMAATGNVLSSLGRADASAALTNPASMLEVENWDVIMNTMTWIADIQYQSVGLVKNFGDLGVIGAHLIILDVGDMVRTEYQVITAGGVVGMEPVTEGLGTVTAGDLSAGLSYARQITDRLQVGGTLRYLQETLDDAVTGNWALDIGTMYHTGIRTWRFWMLGRRFGPDAEFAEYDERIGVEPVRVRMPMVFNFGTAIDLLEYGDNNPHRLSLAGDFSHPNDGPEKVDLGAEYSFKEYATLRAGYRYNYSEAGLTLGAGLQVVTSTFNVQFNYAFMAFGRLGNVNMLSIGLGM